MYRQCKFAAALLATGLSGCGLSVPQIGELWDQDRPADPAQKRPTYTATAQIEYEIKQKVYCELTYAVLQVDNLRPGGAIPKGWGVQMQLTLEVDETVSLSPGVTFTQLLPNVMKIFGVFPNNNPNSVPVTQFFSLGFGGTLSSDAHRIDKFNTYYSIKNLKDHAHDAPCQIDGKPDPQKDPFLLDGWTPAESSPLLIESDLGLKNWLVGAMAFDFALPSTSPQPSAPSTSSNSGGAFEGTFDLANGTFSGTTSSGGKSSPGGRKSSPGGGKPPPGGGGTSYTSSGGDSSFKQDSFSQDIKFIIVSTGNITPTWKLIQLSANTGNAPFFSTGRTRTHELLITIGPPTTRTQNDFLASQIGQAVNRSVVVAP
jgi:hypothetical protein